MGTLIHVVLFVAALAAFGAWSLAALATLNVVNLAPKGEKLSAYYQLGMWRFSDLEAKLGTGVTPHITHYKRAFYVFIAVIAAIVALTFVPVPKTA